MWPNKKLFLGRPACNKEKRWIILLFSIIKLRHFLPVVALLGTIQYSGATHTSATSLPLTSLCSWDYPPVYIGIYRRSPVVRFVGGSYIV